MDRQKKEYLLYRMLEIFPGFLVWATFIAAISVSFLNPILAIYFIIFFDVYWLIRISYLMIYILISWRRYLYACKQNWQSKLSIEFNNEDKNWKDYWHVIFLPTYKESYDIIAASIKAVADSTYENKKHIIIVLTGEERAGTDRFEAIANRIKENFSDTFHSINTMLHPMNLPGDLPGKGSNLYFAGNKIKPIIDELGINYKKIIVSTFDVDTVASPQYFSYLTYHFLSHKNPYQASFQPLTFYHNNIWESDIVTRVVANSTTFWLLTDLARSERLFTFSSHSMSWQALVDVGFWQNNIVTEDSRIFLQCLIHYNGDYKVFPMYTTVSMNTVYMGSFWQSLKNQYKQMERWAYGVEHFPYMMWHFWKNKKIKVRTKLVYLWNQTEGVYSWATAPILMFVVGHLPLMVTNINKDSSFIAQQAPLVLSTIMTIAIWSIIVIAAFSTFILPRKPLKGINKIFQYSIMLIQWVIFPVTMILFGSIPSVQAQTRLMLGKYLDFWVTEKK